MLILAGCFPQDSDGGTPLARTLAWDGLTRAYGIYVPPAQGAEPRGLLVLLHGTGQSPEQFRQTARFGAIEGQPLMLAYPEAVELNWNDGRAAPGIRAYDEDVDDVGFLLAMIDAVAAEFGLDRSRVYAAGFSNGGMMAMRLAIASPATLAGFAAVCAALPENLLALPAPETPVPALLIASPDDRVLPWEGGTVQPNGAFLGTFLSVPDTAAYWAGVNRALAPTTAPLPDAAPRDGCTATETFYPPGSGGADVVLYTLNGGGHSWPGGPQQLDSRSRPVCQDPPATPLIAAFLAQFRRP